MVSAADAEQFRRAQAGIRILVERDLDRLWQQVWSKNPTPQHVRDLFLNEVPALVREYGDTAAALAAQWYEVMRQTYGPSGPFTAVPEQSPYLDAVDPTVRRTAGDLWTPTPDTMLVGLKAVIGKYVLAAGRQTITRNADRDPAAHGWQRVTRVGACQFCSMLAGRGGVYTRESVHFASHGDCNCGAAPSWDPSAEPIDVGAYIASQRTTHMRELDARDGGDRVARHNARVSAWMSAHEGEF